MRLFLLSVLLVTLSAAETPVWRDDFAAAVEEAKDRPLALLFSIPGCTWCQRMLDESTADAAVRSALGEVAGIHVHADQERSLTAQLGIESFPTLVLVNRKRELVRVVRGYLPMADLATTLRVLALHGDKDGQKPIDLLGKVDVAAIAATSDAIPRLVALLGTGPTEQRAEARSTLAGMPSARTALWEALTSSELGVRVDAAAVLERLTCPPPRYDAFAPPAERAREILAWKSAAELEVVP